ncbi:low temperature requirement protein A [Brachybacterium sp. ACRRE]|uniref:low temperature requirement protein A n=1 Tax=Brachybacterium sp. ACRRE TaxID=2918184 RepID=UPI001EF3A82F|nr:low temperature requirement protein A [Brachybacterium sp. ACRRE]MCG7311083.1 low temperature requirement protein A [Brachybacterium sp. ACRRE]
MTTTTASRWRLLPMRPRDPDEEGRAGSSLELFFDLVFVIAVSIAGTELHHALAASHVLSGVGHYAMVLFAIWWAWMNFTWFATSFDTDDWLYRVLTIAQMGGVMVVAAGVGPVFEHDSFGVMIAGYVVMRLAMVVQWLRAAMTPSSTDEARRAALHYAIGIAVVQALWGLILLLPHGLLIPAAIFLILAEISVPVIAEQRGRTPWHPEHITERYGGFTLILLGESLLASSHAILEARDAEVPLTQLVPLGVLCLIVTAALWWVYFWPRHSEAIDGALRNSLMYGYGHYVIFAAAGAFSVGIELEVDVATGESAIGPIAAAYAVSLPIAIFLVGMWCVVLRRSADAVVSTALALAVLVVLIDPLVPLPIALTTIVMALLVAVMVWRRPRTSAR